MFETFLQQAITIFAIVDPLGVSAILLSLAPKNTTKKQMSKIALKSTITIVIAFFVVLFTGDLVLKIFGINIDSLKIMGGIILLLTAIKMVEGSLEDKNQTPQEQIEAKGFDDFAIIPLAIPITFGPGIFATIVIYKAGANSFVDLLGVSLAFLITAIVVYFSFRNSIYIREYLGITGQKIITKLMGLIVGAIAIQFIVSGTVKLGELYM